MSTAPNVVRALTNQEYTQLGTDAFKEINRRLAPAVLKAISFNACQIEINRTKPEAAKDVLTVVFQDYQRAVQMLADIHMQVIRAKFYEPNFLVWDVVPNSIIKRRQLELENAGLERTPDANEFDVAAKNQTAIDQAKADKIERQAQTDVHVAIDKVLFTNVRGIDNRKTDDLRAELRAYVRDAGKKKWSAILAHVTSRIADAHRRHEREQEQWNSR